MQVTTVNQIIAWYPVHSRYDTGFDTQNETVPEFSKPPNEIFSNRTSEGSGPNWVFYTTLVFTKSLQKKGMRLECKTEPKVSTQHVRV